MPVTINPLRYPGAKRSLYRYIRDLLEANHLNGCTFYEPYAGSAAVGLELLQNQYIQNLVICEKDILLYAFWECVFRHTDSLCRMIQDTEITIESWQTMLPYRDIVSLEDGVDIIHLGFAGLFYNRTNFSGILKANPIGGINQTSPYKIDCRFNKEKIIALIRQISTYNECVEVHLGDALQFMGTQANRFLREHCFAYFAPHILKKALKFIDITILTKIIWHYLGTLEMSII